MLNRAPFNTEVPEFLPSRDAPINSYIIRKYPCQEHLAGKKNKFETLTWKIQQPDSSMVWQSVKLVLPMKIECKVDNNIAGDMNVYTRLPCCNIALSQSPMNAFRQTTLSINGRIFSEDNFFRDTLDACYRGIGSQAYGDNHSLKPIVQRDLVTGPEDRIFVVNRAGNPMAFNRINLFVDRTNIQKRTMASAFSLLEHNGPFIERARIFQDNLSFDGKTWDGEISHLLELGPFQARARKGNSAVPYIQDFHLRLNFQNMESRFDSRNKTVANIDGGGRTMATKLLEFATLPNFLHHTEKIDKYGGWPKDFVFTYTAQPYLEIVYTKHEDPMRQQYNLRCFEHLYEQGPRFLLDAPADSFDSPVSLQRVTSRVLSLPTKIYVWAEPADEYKHTFLEGGVRRSCLLKNLHLRVNQRPDVMFNPSQEECYEMFKRHTNSSLEYGSWLKSPIYCFDMVDVGQPDMFANDARITWFEWDAEVNLTELQMTEQKNAKDDSHLMAHGYRKAEDDLRDNFKEYTAVGSWQSPTDIMYGVIDYPKQAVISDNDDTLDLTLLAKRSGTTQGRITNLADIALMKGVDMKLGTDYQDIVAADWLVDTIPRGAVGINGCIWAAVATHTVPSGQTKGDIVSDFLFIPESYRFSPTVKGSPIFNDLGSLDFSADPVKFTNPAHTPVIIQGVLAFNQSALGKAQDGKAIGTVGPTSAKWAPGDYGYKITGAGIENNALLLNSASAMTRVDETKDQRVWCCFGPADTMPNHGGTAWINWLHDQTRVQLLAAGAPPNWDLQMQGAQSDWEYGEECLHLNTGGKWGSVEQQTFRNVVPWVPVRAGRVGTAPTGAQVFINKEAGTFGHEQLFRLKTLYEYGNSQYSFRQDAAPTRILPNLVPVGPSAGIPAL